MSSSDDRVSILPLPVQRRANFVRRRVYLAVSKDSRRSWMDRVLISSAVITGGLTGQKSWPGSKGFGTRQPRLTSVRSRNAARIRVNAEGAMPVEMSLRMSVMETRTSDKVQTRRQHNGGGVDFQRHSPKA